MARGGSRPGAGRRKGASSKLTADVKALAAQYGEQAVQALADIATSAEQSAAARVAAANALLDRGFGKPAQAIAVTGKDGGPVESRAMASTAPLDLSSLSSDELDQLEALLVKANTRAESGCAG